jgi:hypothetical protein
MHKLKLLTLGMFTACTAGVLAAQSPAKPDFGWLGGYWCSGSGGRLIEEYWLPANGDPGLMIGLSRTVKGGRTVNFEFLRITLEAGGANYLAQPQGVPPIAFRLTASGEGWARFENPQHDFPKRVEYRRTSGGLQAEIAGPGEDGKERVIPFHYKPCAAPAPG